MELDLINDKSSLDILREHVKQSRTKVQQISVLYKEIESLCNEANYITDGKILHRLEGIRKVPYDHIFYIDKPWRSVSDFLRITRPLFRFGRFRVKFIWCNKSVVHPSNFGGHEYSYYNYERLSDSSLNYMIQFLKETKEDINKIIREF